eukprot:COSAG04_NODE_4074_length_2320_cov_6.171544_1_plen_121_part_10
MYYQSAGGLAVRSSVGEVRQLLAEGTITRRTLVYWKGAPSREWVPVADVAGALLTTARDERGVGSVELVSPRRRTGRRGALWAVTDEISAHGHNVRAEPSTDAAVVGLVFTGERLLAQPSA